MVLNNASCKTIEIPTKCKQQWRMSPVIIWYRNQSTPYIMLLSLGIWIFSSLIILTLHSYQTTFKSTFQSALQVDLKGLKNPQ